MVFSDVNGIAVVQGGTLDAHVIDESAIQARKIFHYQAAAIQKYACVVIRDCQVVHGQIVIGRTANADGPGAHGHLFHLLLFEH